MARNLAAAGYESVSGSLYAPPRITAKIVQNYHICSVTARLANSDFFSDEDLFCGSKVIYGIEQDLNMFASDRDINENPETMSGSPTDSASLTICQSQKYRWKLSNHDRRIMCDNFSRWENALRRLISRNIIRLVDAYSIPKILASAAPHNVGVNAGKVTRSVNLGDQGANALVINSPADFEQAVYSLLEVAQEAGILCGEGEMPMEGEGGRPILLVPAKLQRHALGLLRQLNQCCSDRNALVTGEIGNLLGMPVLVTGLLQSIDLGAGPTVPMAIIDPKQVLHAFDVIVNKWFEGEFEDYLVGEFVFETHVFNQDGIVVANVAV